MRHFFRLLQVLFCCTFSSCAIILNKPTTSVKVYSKQDSTYLWVNDTEKVELPAKMEVKRSRENLAYKVSRQGREDTLVIKSRISPTYLYPNLFTYYLGYIVDLASKKKYTYQSPFYINFDHANFYRFRFPPKRGTVYYSMEVPLLNGFSLNKSQGEGSYFGFLGFAPSFSYYYLENWFLHVQPGVASNIPGNYRVNGWENIFCAFLKIGNGNSFFNWIQLHYGFHYSAFYNKFIPEDGETGFMIEDKYMFGPFIDVNIFFHKQFYLGFHSLWGVWDISDYIFDRSDLTVLSLGYSWNPLLSKYYKKKPMHVVEIAE